MEPNDDPDEVYEKALERAKERGRALDRGEEPPPRPRRPPTPPPAERDEPCREAELLPAPNLRPALEKLGREGLVSFRASSPRETRANVLREIGRTLLSDPERRYMARLAGPRLLDGSILGEWIDVCELPENTLDVLRATFVLSEVRRSSDELERDVEGVRASIERVRAQRLVTARLSEEPVDEQSEPIPSLRTTEAYLVEVLEAVRSAHQTIESGGYGWDDGLVERKGGRKSRAGPLFGKLVRVLAHAWVQTPGGEPSSTPEAREWIAYELAPFFPASSLDTSKGSPLHDAAANSPAFRRR